MEGKSLSWVRSLIGGERFEPWCNEYLAIWRRIEAAHERYPDPLTHSIWRGGELEERSADAHAGYLELEASFDTLSSFEEERQHTKELWTALEGTEQRLEDQRANSSDLKARIDARRRGRRMTSGPQEHERREREVADLDVELEKTARIIESLRARYQESCRRRDDLWSQVETQWTDAFRHNMARAEYEYVARRVRAAAEHWSVETGTGSGDADGASLDRELQELEAELLAKAREGEKLFECVIVREFLYWPRWDDITTAWCVPLHADRDHLNVQVEPFRIYEVERSKGIEFIEPIPEQGEGDDDPRLETFFLVGRPTS